MSLFPAEEASISITVDSGSSLTQTCGLCGTQSGQLLTLSGGVATSLSERAEFVESYRVPAAEMSLRPVRTECSKCVHSCYQEGGVLLLIVL